MTYKLEDRQARPRQDTGPPPHTVEFTRTKGSRWRTSPLAVGGLRRPRILWPWLPVARWASVGRQHGGGPAGSRSWREGQRLEVPRVAGGTLWAWPLTLRERVRPGASKGANLTSLGFQGRPSPLATGSGPRAAPASRSRFPDRRTNVSPMPDQLEPVADSCPTARSRRILSN